MTSFDTFLSIDSILGLGLWRVSLTPSRLTFPLLISHVSDVWSNGIEMRLPIF